MNAGDPRSACDLTDDRANRLAQALVHDLDLTRSYILDLALTCADDYDRDEVLKLAGTLDSILADASVLADNPIRHFSVVRNLANELAPIHFDANDRARLVSYRNERARGRARDLDRGFIHVRSLADELADELARARPGTRTAGASGQRKVKGIAPWAASLLAAAVRLLPAADRARYAEEYLSELWDLAQSGARRRRQLGYALRQFRSAPLLGFALRFPRRRGAAP